MNVYCEVCGKNITEAGEQDYICDDCEKIICPDCNTGGFGNTCVECVKKR